MLIETTLFETINKVNDAIQVLKDLEPKEGYYLADSGGKDSCVVLELVKMAGVKFDAHHSFTTIDPPELIRFLKKEHPETDFIYPKMHLVWKIKTEGYPTRQFRWCCKLYKENGGDGRLVITGIRAEESSKRAGRSIVESCYKGKGKRYLNIILHWTELEVWEFIHKYYLPYCKLYDEGWKRIGCLFCPMNSKRKDHIKMYPGYVKLFIKGFEKRYEYAKERGLTSATRFKSGKEMFDFWINEDKNKEDPDQTVLFE